MHALLGETHEFLVIENGEIVEIAGSSVGVFTTSGEPVERESFEVDWDAEAVELGGYDDYMLKEIHEQPAALGATLLGRIDSGGVVDLSEVGLDFSEIDRVDGRLWHGLPRRPAGQTRHREARQDTRRGGDRQRVSLREPHRGRRRWSLP